MSNWISKYLIGTTCFLCSTFLLTGNTVAKTSERLESIRQIINELHPKATFSDEFAEGDLDGDGIVDIAYIVHVGHANDVVLGVLRGKKTGQLVAWEVSKPFANAHHGIEISIDKQSIFIHGFNGGAPSKYESHWQDQFQIRNGQFVLIGNETSNSALSNEGANKSQESTATSTNYLTRKIITTTNKDKKKNVRTEFLPAGTKLRLLRDYGT